MSGLTQNQVHSAADMLVALREGRLNLVGLPAEVTPENTADVQRIINAVSERLVRPTRGWKIYTVYKPMNPPFYAPIYDLFESGATIPGGISPMRLIEPEIMFRIDQELPARGHNYGIAQIMESVTAVVGFEVIGSRFRAPDASSTAQTSDGQGSLYGSLSDHIANGCIVIGDSIPHWQDVAFEDVGLRLTEDGRQIIEIVGCHPFDNPFLPVVVAVNRLRRHLGVMAGDIIVTNSSTSVIAVGAGSLIHATYEGLGEVTATFEV